MAAITRETDSINVSFFKNDHDDDDEFSERCIYMCIKEMYIYIYIYIYIYTYIYTRIILYLERLKDIRNKT